MKYCIYITMVYYYLYSTVMFDLTQFECCLL